MNNTLRLGLIGFGITLVLNLLGIFVFQKPAAEFFSSDWWSTWFPSLVVWLVILVSGIGLELSRKDKNDKSTSR